MRLSLLLSKNCCFLIMHPKCRKIIFKSSVKMSICGRHHVAAVTVKVLHPVWTICSNFISKFIQKATDFGQHLASIHIATRQVQSILQKFMNVDVTAHKCSIEKQSSICFLYCSGILYVMTSDTFVTGVKSVVTPALRGEG